MSDLPKLTVIVPCRNEGKFIGQCLESIVRNDYPRDRIEVLVLDGMSEDESWPVIEEYSAKYCFLTGLRNTRKITPAALNLGIDNANGEIICRIDAHASVSPDYLRTCVETLLKSDADNVGGEMRTLPAKSGLIATAIALAMSHMFGVGNSRFRTTQAKPIWTDTVFGGCYRKQIFDRIGLFNEELSRGQDMEFNRRLRAAGGKILLDPRLKSTYYASPNLGSFWRHNFRDGEWAIRPFAFSKVVPIRFRHTIPLAFVSALLALAIGTLWSRALLIDISVLILVYAALSFTSSIQIALHQRDWRFIFMMPAIFGVRHFAYGLGSLKGVISLLRRFLFARRPIRGTCNSSR